ncbi:MAG: outer membrane protein assembly factor BamB family protein, partial [Planctomycetota bacterium]
PKPIHDPFGEIRKARSNSTVNMHLLPAGEFEVGTDRWGPIVRVNMLKVTDWSKVPGVKKAWPMKGYEGVEGMAFHPVISEVKDVDGDGVVDIFRCRSEHEGARIERLRYADGSVVWESPPMGALHGDESRLAVFDLDGDGVFSVLHSTKSGVYCVSARTGKTEWAEREAVGDLTAGRFLDRKRQGVLVRSTGTLRCYDHAGKLSWTHETGLKGGSAYSHELYRFDADGDGLDEIFANWQRLTLALRGDGTVLWEDRTQRHHSDYIVGGDLDGDGATELLYDHQGCGAEKGPLYVVDAMSGKVRLKIDYRADGLRHAQNMALGDFDKDRPGLEIAMCGKRGGLMMWDSGGRPVWKRNVPASLLSKGDWDGDGAEEITCHALGANVDGMFSVWTGKGERLYAISFLPSPSRRTWSDKHNGGSWSHATPGGHEGVRRQVDLDGNGRADFILGFGAWHWGADSILFLMEGPPATPPARE